MAIEDSRHYFCLCAWSHYRNRMVGDLPSNTYGFQLVGTS